METIISISDVDSKLFDGDFAELFSSENCLTSHPKSRMLH